MQVLFFLNDQINLLFGQAAYCKFFCNKNIKWHLRQILALRHLLPLESSTSSAGVWFLEVWWACEAARLTMRGLGSVSAFPCTFKECSFSWLIVMVENEQEEHL